MQTVPGQLHRYQDVSVRAYLVATLSALAAPQYLLKLKIPLLSTLFMSQLLTGEKLSDQDAMKSNTKLYSRNMDWEVRS